MNESASLSELIKLLLRKAIGKLTVVTKPSPLGVIRVSHLYRRLTVRCGFTKTGLFTRHLFTMMHDFIDC
ncbi:hypothetical protein KJY73_01965 [Bowmanella sp. Y26]|nr:hypothetical protein [Bowmanella yangjiangensis]